MLGGVTAVRSGTIPNKAAESRVVEVAVRPLGGIIEEGRNKRVGHGRIRRDDESFEK